MLQNISRDFYTNEQSGTLNSFQSSKRDKFNNNNGQDNQINFLDIFTKLFTVRNVVIYALTLMISMVSLGSNTSFLIAPFGLALVAAATSTGVPIAGVYIASLIGTAIKFGTNTTLIYIASSIVLLIISLIKRPQRDETINEKIRLGGYLFFSTLSVQLVYIVFSGFYFYDLLVATMMSIAAYVFYKIFVNSIEVISKYGIKKAFSVEEIIGASLLIAIAISAIGDFSIFSFSIRNILCIFLVLTMGWRNGILVGGTSGITVGVVLGIIGNGDPIIIAAYAISGMIAGLLNKFGKIGVILGFILGNIIVAYSANGGTSNIIMFQEILIAAIGLLALPKKTKITLEDIIPQTKLLPEGGGRIEESPDTLLKLNSISDAIDEMTSGYKNDESYEKNEETFENEIIKALDGYEGNILYDDIYNNENDIIGDIFDLLNNNNIITENGIISIFASHNIYLMNSNDATTKNIEKEQIRQIVKIINSSYRICKNNFIWQKKMDENNKNMAKQLQNVKNAINDITTKIEENTETFDKEETQIKEQLLEENVKLENIQIKKGDADRTIVKIYTPKCEEEDGTNCPIKTINKILNKTLNEKFTTQTQNCGLRLNKNTCEYTYISEDKYMLITGIATAKKEDSIVSGDVTSQIRLEDGKYMLAISDAMGSGADSRRNSKIAISMLERLLGTGFNKETSINLINSAILNANKEDMYATLDIGIFDLYGGKMELIKSGACPTYVKRNHNVSVIKSTSLPAGIVNDIKVDAYDKEIEDGDIIILCSDGIIESNNEYSNKELWIKYLLEDIQTDSPERIADIILKEAIDNNIGKAKDDMSVIVGKIVKKK